MNEREADERYTRLVANVAEARDLLTEAGDDHGEDGWQQFDADLTAHDAYGLKRLLCADEGMGSFNDVEIHPGDDMAEVNRSFESLRTTMYADAHALLAEFERGH